MGSTPSIESCKFVRARVCVCVCVFIRIESNRIAACLRCFDLCLCTDIRTLNSSARELNSMSGRAADKADINRRKCKNGLKHGNAAMAETFAQATVVEKNAAVTCKNAHTHAHAHARARASSRHTHMIAHVRACVCG
jgi:ElaB/YqjD/DUF883 family membrane-anchored ribosome-binding protein